MKKIRKTNGAVDRFCIFITREKKEDGSEVITQDEFGDESLRGELIVGIAEEMVNDLRNKLKSQ